MFISFWMAFSDELFAKNIEKRNVFYDIFDGLLIIKKIIIHSFLKIGITT